MTGINDSLRVLSRNLRHYRRVARLTQGDLALMMGCSQKVISHWENLGKGKGYQPPRLEKMVELADILHEPVAHLLGVMKGHSYTTQDAADFLGIDPAAVDAIRELSGHQSDGSYEQMLDYSTPLSALLVELTPAVLYPLYDLIAVSWGVRPLDDPRQAAEAHTDAVKRSEEARFNMWSALDSTLRQAFVVPDIDAFTSDAGRQLIQQRETELGRETQDIISGEEWRDSIPAITEALRKVVDMSHYYAADRIEVRRRLAGFGKAADSSSDANKH
nr:helix-turn-helix transcriptional regulator [Bifidobacterium crudilactis]